MIQVATFKVGASFPHLDRQKVQIVRLLLAVQPLVALARCMLPIRDDDSPAAVETAFFLRHLGMAATYEAWKIFDEANGEKVFDSILQSEGAEILHPHYDRLANPSADLLKALKTARSKAAFHWDYEQVKGSLRLLKDLEFPIAHTTDGTFEQTSFPLLTPLLDKVMDRKSPGWDNEIAGAVQMQLDLQQLAQSTYAIAIASRDPGTR